MCSTRTSTKNFFPVAGPHCIICLRRTIIHPDPRRLSRYLELLERYLKLESRSSAGSNLCEECTPILESFSHLYDKLREMELKVEWKVWSLKNIMRGSNRVTSRGDVAREWYKRKGLRDVMEKMFTRRRKIYKRCSVKLSSSFPKVLLPKLTIYTISPVEEPVSSSSEKCDQDHDIIEISPAESQRANIIEIAEVESDRSDCTDKTVLIPLRLEPSQTTPQMEYKDEDDTTSSIDDGEDMDMQGIPDVVDIVSSSGSEVEVAQEQSSKELGTPLQSKEIETCSKGKPPFLCSVCPKSFSSSGSLKSHHDSCHDLTGINPSDVIWCDAPACNAYFRIPAQLRSHKATFHQRGNKKCPGCGKCFDTGWNLVRHYKSHCKHVNKQITT